MFIKGFIYRLPHIEIDRDVSNTYCRSSSGDNVDLLSRTFQYTTVVVSDWCITNHAHLWWVSIQSIVGIIRGGNYFLSGPLSQRSAAKLSDRRHPRFRKLNSTVPVNIVMVKSCASI